MSALNAIGTGLVDHRDRLLHVRVMVLDISTIHSRTADISFRQMLHFQVLQVFLHK